MTHLVESPVTCPRICPYRGAVLVVFGRSKPGWLVFDCPCKRRHRAMLNLDPEAEPVVANPQPRSVNDLPERG